MKHYLDLYFNPTGRVSRRTWCRQAVNILIVAAIIFVAATFLMIMPGVFIIAVIRDVYPSVVAGLENEPYLPKILPISGYIVVPAMIWCSIALNVKRLHDQDRSAAWLFLLLLPVIGWIVLVILIGFVPGTEGWNRYGPVHRAHAPNRYPFAN